MRARLETLEQALDRGEGLTPAVRALKAAGAKLVVAGVEAQPGYERAVAAGLGWRAGAVVAERLSDALAVLAEAGGEVAVDPGRHPPAGRVASARRRRPAADRARHRPRPDRGTAARGGLAGRRSGRCRSRRRGDAGGRGHRRRPRRAVAHRRRRRGGLDGGPGRARPAGGRGRRDAARARESAARPPTPPRPPPTGPVRPTPTRRPALAALRAREAGAAEAARTAAARRDRMADEVGRVEGAREAAERDLAAETGRGAELEREAVRLEAAAEARVAAAQAADHRHAALEMRRRELAEAAARLAAQEAGLRERAERFRSDAARLRSAGERARASAKDSGRMAATARALEARGRAIGEMLVRLSAAAELLRTPARAGVAVIEQRSGELAAELQACAHDEAAVQVTGARRRRHGHRDRGRAHPLHRPHRRARPAARRDRGRRRRPGSPIPNEPLPVDERAAIAARLERLERRRESLGAVNPLAAEEYEAEKQRTGELTEQCADLERSLRELRGLIRDLTQTIDHRFAETFDQVARNFTEVIRTLFPGGSGRLRLTADDVVSAAPEDAAERRGGSRRRARHRARGEAGRQAHRGALAALRRREGADGDRVPVRAAPDQAVAVLRPGRGRGRARRRQHRALPRPAARLPGAGPVHRHHPPAADDGGGRPALRGHDGRRRRVEGALAPGRPRRRAAPGRRRVGRPLRRVALHQPLVVAEAEAARRASRRRACAGSSAVGEGAVLDDLAHELDAEAGAAVLGEHVDVGQVDEMRRVAVDGAGEPDLAALVVEADDVLAGVDQLVLPLAGAAERPVGRRQVGMHRRAVEAARGQRSSW